MNDQDDAAVHDLLIGPVMNFGFVAMAKQGREAANASAGYQGRQNGRRRACRRQGRACTG
jgi:hypothetical protein